MKKKIAILGSTGSIGTQALEVIEQQKDYFEVEILTAHNNADLLIKQAIQHKPNAVVITNDHKYLYVKDTLEKYDIKVFAGEKALEQIVESGSIDIVLTAMVGYAGLIPTVNAIKAGKNIALANKETLVVAGDLISDLANKYHVDIYPIDSEHSAIFQCLAGEVDNPIEKIYLTASGGPFRNTPKQDLYKITKEQALKHPNWDMGAKITIDSATMMNKGLEVIEAKWLFNLKPEQIDVVVHPQSIVHSIVQFQDGSMKAQMGLPDMKLPILYALSFPKRLKTKFARFDFMAYPELTFSRPDTKNFRNLAIAYEVMKQGGNMPCIMNAANEIAVEAFLTEKIGFMDIPEIIEKTLANFSIVEHPELEDYITYNKEARIYAENIIN